MSDNPRKQDRIEFSQKEVGQLVAVLLFGAFFIFVAGYFFGKKKMLEELSVQHQSSEFADKIYNSFISMNSDNDLEVEQSAEEEQDAETGDSCGAFVSDEPEQEALGSEATELDGKNQETIMPSEAKHENVAYAQLCGFGTKKAAERYLAKLSARQVDANVVERKSRSKKGKVIFWYQVVTNPMEKRDLLPLVKKIKKHDKLTDVKIIDLHTDGA